MDTRKPPTITHIGMVTIVLAAICGFAFRFVPDVAVSFDWNVCDGRGTQQAQNPLVDKHAEILKPPVEAPVTTESKTMGGLPPMPVPSAEKRTFHIPVKAGQKAKNPLMEPNAEILGNVETPPPPTTNVNR